MSFHSHNRYRQAIRFRWDLPRIDPAWVVLLGSIKDVRAAAGQDGVNAFIDEWRKRGYIECSDEDAEKLKQEGSSDINGSSQ
jgi:hypothetical protein